MRRPPTSRTTRGTTALTDLHRRWWKAGVTRQKDIDSSIAAKMGFEYLYDKPYEDRGIISVASPFTVETLAPHRTLGVDENDELIDHLAESKTGYREQQDFATMILEHLKTSGVQQAHREDRISFTALTPWPGHLICAEGRCIEGDSDAGTERRAGIFIDPEFGTVTRPDLVAAARELTTSNATSAAAALAARLGPSDDGISAALARDGSRPDHSFSAVDRRHDGCLSPLRRTICDG